jgi:opacity protein-like surface antigen
MNETNGMMEQNPSVRKTKRFSVKTLGDELRVKSLIATVALLVSVAAMASAQDIIVTTKSEKITAKITEIEVDVVKYKKYDNQDGPTYTIRKADIASIMYKNGQVEVFEQSQQAQQPQGVEKNQPASQKTKPVSEKGKSSYELPYKFRVGGIAGLNLAKYSVPDEVPNMKSKAGMRLGLTGEYSLMKYVAIAPELVFAQKGMMAKTKEDDYWAKYSYRFSYLEIPINVVGRYFLNKDLGIYAIAGPCFSFALAKSIAYKDSEGESEKEKLENEGFNSFDFGLTFGAGAEYKNIFLRLQYEVGLVNILKDSDGKWANRNFNISIGYYFLKK